MAVVLATGVTAQGQREVLGLDLGPREAGAFWTAFLRSLTTRGLQGVQLVSSAAHTGLNGVIAAVLQGATGQRCRVHLLRHVRGLVPKASLEMVAATIRTVFAQPDAARARERWRTVADKLQGRFPLVAGLMEEAEVDLLAYADFPAEHGRKIWSNNPIERRNTEIKRRSEVVGSLPNNAAVIRLVGAVLAEHQDEWQVARRYLSAKSMTKLSKEAPSDPVPVLTAVP
jgi:putative transposase